MAKFSIGSIVQVVAGAALLATGNVGAGVALLAGGALTVIAGAFTKPPESESDYDRTSPTYGFGQWNNRTKGDAVLPVIYTGHEDGHKIAPVYIQAYATPKGEHDDDFAKVLKAKGQGLSALLAIGEGPIAKIEDVRFNDEPVFEKVGAEKRKLIATGNGSKKRFTFNASRAYLPSFEIYVGGTLKGWKHQARTFTYIAPANQVGRAVFTTGKEEIADDRNLAVTINGTALDTENTTQRRPHIWLDSPTQLRLDMQQSYPNATRVDVTAYTRIMDGLDIEHDGDGKWTLVFATAPASGAKIEATYLRKMFRGLNIAWRNGADHQLAIPGFESIRNTVGVSTELTSTETTKSTENEVDNIVITLASGQSGFTEYDEDGGARQAVQAQFTIELKLVGSNPSSIYNSWTKIYDPAGKKGKKSASEFAANGESISQLFFSYSIKGLLDKYIEKNPKSTLAQRMRRNFVRAKYQIRIKRTNSIRSNSNSLVYDDIFWSSFDEVIDEKLSYPGVAMLGVHAVANEKLQGSAPNLTLRARGLRSVEKWTGSAWSEDEDAQGNRVWAAIDLLTHRRYGSGDQFTKAANVDTTSALAAANWLDETIERADGADEVRSRLDLVLDTRKSPIQWAMDILRPGRVLPVLQGNTWKFVIDDAVTLADCPVVYEDTTAQRVARDSVRLRRDSQARIPTELQTRFIDEAEDFEPREVWIAPETPTDDRRVAQGELIGITRRSEATRASRALYKQMTADGMALEFLHAPGGIEWEAGDVIRFISSRMGIDRYWRVARMAFGTKDYFVKVECIPYIPAVYGQQDAPQSTQTTGTTANAPRPLVIRTRQPRPSTDTDTKSRAGGRRSKPQVTVRRVA